MSASCSTSYVIPLSIGCSYNTRFSSSSPPSSLSSLIISGRTASFPNLRLRLVLGSATNHRPMSRVRVRIPWRTPWGTRSQRFRAAVSRVEPEPEPDRIDDSKIKEEANKGNDIPAEETPVAEHNEKSNQLKKRIVSGLGIAVSTGGIVLAGGWVFTIAVAAAVFVASREYFDLVRSCGIADGMTPPPRYVSRVCSIVFALMPLFTLYLGSQIDVAVTSAALVVAIALLVQRRIPRFSELSSAMFGLFYCGCLPCFWVKLRCLAAPALNTTVANAWPVLLGGRTQWTVGLVATLISISSVIAADTFAFAGGKAFGRRQLTHISPKKTWEGVFAGLGGCIVTTLFLSKVLCWPNSVLGAVAFGFIMFIGSLSGDLLESVIKRDAGKKDSGSLIPGHGGVLDRVDSYLLTGALAYSFIKFLELYGV